MVASKSDHTFRKSSKFYYLKLLGQFSQVVSDIICQLSPNTEPSYLMNQQDFILAYWWFFWWAFTRIGCTITVYFLIEWLKNLWFLSRCGDVKKRRQRTLQPKRMDHFLIWAATFFSDPWAWETSLEDGLAGMWSKKFFLVGDKDQYYSPGCVGKS